jgi:hypothetical protein
MVESKTFFFSIVLFLFFSTLLSGCTSNDIKIVDIKKFEDTNISYSNFSCQTDAKIATITKYSHTEKDIIEIKYSYFLSTGNCYNEGALSLTNFKPDEIYHHEFGFTDYLVNRLSITYPVFKFKAIRTTYIERK